VPDRGLVEAIAYFLKSGAYFNLAVAPVSAVATQAPPSVRE
jgi:hypothetical protein